MFVSDRFRVLSQYFLPKQALTIVAGKLAGARCGALSHFVIRRFIAHYGVDMSEAAQPEVRGYASFNDFFTRALRADARIQTRAAWSCPVDGAISQFGDLKGDQIFQAKGHHYSTRALVGGDAKLAEQFRDGKFATLYLSPKDYHRIHMPCDGKLLRMIHIPGDLFSVNPVTARGVPGLFARNERLVCVFESIHGPLVLALVGATIVGSMATVWHGLVNPPRSGVLRELSYDEQNISLKKGDEMGRFLLGSTVVLLMPRSSIQFNPDWSPDRSIRMGEEMGT